MSLWPSNSGLSYSSGNDNDDSYTGEQKVRIGPMPLFPFVFTIKNNVSALLAGYACRVAAIAASVTFVIVFLV